MAKDNRRPHSGRYFRMKKDIWCDIVGRGNYSSWLDLTDGKIYEILGEDHFMDDVGYYYSGCGRVVRMMPVVTLEEYLLEICREQEDV